MSAGLDVEQQKRAAAEAAAQLVQDGQRVGLGTGSTVAHLLPALAARGLEQIRCVATSPRTLAAARALGLHVEPFTELAELDIAIDGADQVAPDGWLVKGGGGAHLREKIVAAAARRFVVIADASKPVGAPRAPIPVELVAFGLPATLALLPGARLRDAPPTPDGGVLADLHEQIGDPGALAARLEAVPGLVAHGLFPPALTHDVFVAGPGGAVEHRVLQPPRRA